ncbi:MAG: acetyl-CoA hydrolase/transferase family protein [Candidatus Nanopelagicales bacterium]
MARRNVPAQRVSAAEAAAVVRSGDWVDYGAVLCQPDAFDRALASRADELRQVKIRSCITARPRAVLEADPDGEHFYWFSLHMSGYDRKKADAGRATYLPVNLGEIPDYYRRFIDPVDVLVIKTRPMDEDGYFNLGPSNLWHRAVAERARIIVVEETPGLPHAYGEDNALHVSEVDYVIPGDDGPPPTLANPPASDVDAAVARLIAAEVVDGSCLQIGIGAMPNAVCSLLLDSDVRDLGVHSEMLTDGIIELYQAGKITGAHKTLQPGRIGYSFALGSQALYDAIDRNHDLVCLPVERTNLPHVVAQNDRVVSINSTTAVDLTGQAASESDGHRQISGTGGQLQFVRGAYASYEGKSFMCLTSTYERHGERKSRIVLEHRPGTVITTPRTDVMYVVTEFGIANLKGKSVAERAHALIAIAHPDFREDLERQAYENRLIPRGLAF